MSPRSFLDILVIETLFQKKEIRYEAFSARAEKLHLLPFTVGDAEYYVLLKVRHAGAVPERQENQ